MPARTRRDYTFVLSAWTSTAELADPTDCVQICNDSASELKFNCTSVHDWFSKVAGSCCTQAYTKSKGISGRLLGDQNWNVAVAYGNCNHGQDADKPSMGPKEDPWGPNGACENA